LGSRLGAVSLLIPPVTVQAGRIGAEASRSGVRFAMCSPSKRTIEKREHNLDKTAEGVFFIRL
jgi:hypothetical protein